MTKVVCEHQDVDVIHDKWGRCPLCDLEREIEELKEKLEEAEALAGELEVQVSDLRSQLEDYEALDTAEEVLQAVGWNREGF
jgi:DNA repair exonuclease SbcCD ATPase subunit